MNKPTRPDAVFDCMVYLQAVVHATGPAAQIVREVEAGNVVLFVSEEIITEVIDVLSRPKLRQKFRHLTSENADKLVQFLRDKGSFIATVPTLFHYERDPKDEKYVNLALAAHASHLVSRDNDLLDLMDESQSAGKEFRHRFPELTILDPVAFLRVLRSAQGEKAGSG